MVIYIMDSLFQVAIKNIDLLYRYTTCNMFGLGLDLKWLIQTQAKKVWP